MHARAWLRLSFLALALTAAPAFLAHLPAQARTAETQTKADTEVFDEVWRLVRDKFYDRNLKGLDWEAVGKRHRADYAAATTDAQRSAVINAMLAELGAPHRATTPGRDRLLPACRHLLRRAAARPPEGLPRQRRSNIRASACSPARSTASCSCRGAFAGLPADKAGVLVGDEIVDVDGAPFEPVGSFDGKADQTGDHARSAARPMAPLSIVDGEPVWIEPGEAFESGPDGQRPHHRDERRRRSATSVSGRTPATAIRTCSRRRSRRQAQGRRRADLGPARRLGRRAAATISTSSSQHGPT